jgi:hypothetical protein
MPYFTPAKGLLDIPALWGHKLKPNMPLLDRPRIIPRALGKQFHFCSPPWIQMVRRVKAPVEKRKRKRKRKNEKAKKKEKKRKEKRKWEKQRKEK